MKLVPTLILSAAAIAVALIVAPPSHQVRLPVGAVVAWPSDRPPQGWMVCDGRPLAEREYPELFAVLGRRYGSGVDASGVGLKEGDFNLPDYRGLFLRGVLGDRQDWLREGQVDLSWADVGRFDLVGESHAVGSLQLWATARPNRLRDDSGILHAFVASQQKEEPCPSTQPVPRDAPTVVRPDLLYALRWDFESRPANIYVHWIIRVR